MHGAIKLMRAWAAGLTVTVFLLSGTAFGLTANDEISPTLNRFPLLDPAGHLSVAYRILPGRFDSALNTSEPGREETPAAQGGDRTAVPSIGYYAKEFFPDLWGGTKRIFSRDNLPLALIGVGLTGLAFTVDHRVQEYFQDRKPLEDVENIGYIIGAGSPEMVVSFALLGTGELINNKRLADTGVVSLEAYLINGIATLGLKYAVGRERPDGSDHLSFPSGHASLTATMAASISEMYDWDLRLAIPLYLTATFVGATRFQANEHYLSDVVAGITLGTLVGISVAKYHKEKDANNGAGTAVTIVPVVSGDYKGIDLIWRF